AELAYSHTATSNVYVGQTFENDRVALIGSLPIPPADRTHLTAGASLAYQHGRTLSVDSGMLAGSVDSWTAHASRACTALPGSAMSARDSGCARSRPIGMRWTSSGATERPRALVPPWFEKPIR